MVLVFNNNNFLEYNGFFICLELKDGLGYLEGVFFLKFGYGRKNVLEYFGCSVLF